MRHFFIASVQFYNVELNLFKTSYLECTLRVHRKILKPLVFTSYAADINGVSLNPLLQFKYRKHLLNSIRRHKHMNEFANAQMDSEESQFKFFFCIFDVKSFQGRERVFRLKLYSLQLDLSKVVSFIYSCF